MSTVYTCSVWFAVAVGLVFWWHYELNTAHCRSTGNLHCYFAVIHDLYSPFGPGLFYREVWKGLFTPISDHHFYSAMAFGLLIAGTGALVAFAAVYAIATFLTRRFKQPQLPQSTMMKFPTLVKGRPQLIRRSTVQRWHQMESADGLV